MQEPLEARKGEEIDALRKQLISAVTLILAQGEIGCTYTVYRTVK